MTKPKPRYFRIGGSDRNQELMRKLQALFEEHDGKRVVGKIRVETFDGRRKIVIKAFIGSYAGMEVDLTDRQHLHHTDERVRQLFETIVGYTDAEVLEAATTSLSWRFDEHRSSDENDDVIIEHSVGNPQFINESIRSIVALADKIN